MLENALDRLETGRAGLARCLKILLARNRLSHTDLKRLHDWACPGATSWLATSQISGLRTQKFKMPGPRLFDGLGQVNLRLAELSGAISPDLRDLPALPSLPHELAYLTDEAWFLQHPGSGLPMNAGDLFMVWIGRLDPEVEEDSYSDRQARMIVERLGLAVQRWMLEQGLLPTQARGRVLSMAGCPTDIELWSALMGASSMDGEDLSLRLPSLLALLGQMGPGRPLTRREWDRWVSTGALPPGSPDQSPDTSEEAGERG